MSLPLEPFKPLREERTLCAPTTSRSANRTQLFLRRLDRKRQYELKVYCSAIADVHLRSAKWPLSRRLLPLSQSNHRMVGPFTHLTGKAVFGSKTGR